jgi:signal transduction histidine kinase
MIDLIPAFIYAKDAQAASRPATSWSRRAWASLRSRRGKSDFDFFAREMAEKFFADEQALLPPANHSSTAKNSSSTNCPVPTRHPHFQGAAARRERERHRNRRHRLRHHRAQGRGRTHGLERPARVHRRLAAGVAHEINTPVQYLNDSVSFIREGVGELLAYIDKLHASLPQKPEDNDDVDYFAKELPPALTRVAEGLARIAEIVRSMKHFSHADQREMSEVDLNASIASTLVIARSEYGIAPTSKPTTPPCRR